MKREEAIATAQAEIDRYERIKFIIDELDLGGVYKINCQHRWGSQDTFEFVGKVVTYNKLSIRFQILTAKKLTSKMESEMRSMLRKKQQDARQKGMDPSLITVAKDALITSSVTFEEFLEWSEWDPADAPLIVNNAYISDKLKLDVFRA